MPGESRKAWTLKFGAFEFFILFVVLMALRPQLSWVARVRLGWRSSRFFNSPLAITPAFRHGRLLFENFLSYVNRNLLETCVRFSH
jgi:hypothetical protein